MSIRSKPESLELSRHSRMAYVSLAQTSAVTVASYLWFMRAKPGSLWRGCSRCSMHQLPLIVGAVTALSIIFWQSKHLVEIAFWTWTLRHLLADLSVPERRRGPSPFLWFLRRAGQAPCPPAVLQNGLSRVLSSSTGFIFLQTPVTLSSRGAISFLFFLSPARGCVLGEHLANNHHINEENESQRGWVICWRWQSLLCGRRTPLRTGGCCSSTFLPVSETFGLSNVIFKLSYC